MGIERGRGAGGGGGAFWDLTGDVLSTKAAIGELVIQLGDDAGAKKEYLKNLSGADVQTRDSLGNSVINGNMNIGGNVDITTGNFDVSTGDTVLSGKLDVVGRALFSSYVQNLTGAILDQAGIGNALGALRWQATSQGYAAQIQNTNGGPNPSNALLLKLTGTNVNSYALKCESGGVNRFYVRADGLSRVNGDLTITGNTLKLNSAEIEHFAGNIILQNLLTGQGVEQQNNSGVKVAETDSDGNISQRSPTYGGEFILKKYEALVDLSGATQITLNIPANAVILGTAFVVKTAITGSGGLTDWSAAFSGGSLLSIVTAQALAKNTKAKKAHVGIETTATTQIEISANGAETFSAGEIVAVCLVREITDLDSFS
jgi:hypothetical protein